MCYRSLQFGLQFTYSPTVRSLFRRRAGKGVRAKLSEGVFAVLGDSYAGFPGKSVTKIPQISVPNLNLNLFESSWGSGFRSLPYGKLHAIALRTVQLLFLSRSPQAFFRTLPEL